MQKESSSPMEEYWVSTLKMTFWVKIDEFDLIVEIAPIGRKFLNQPFDNLVGWLRRQGEFKMERLDPEFEKAVDEELWDLV
jgi:hypothetical protein